MRFRDAESSPVFDADIAERTGRRIYLNKFKVSTDNIYHTMVTEDEWMAYRMGGGGCFSLHHDYSAVDEAMFKLGVDTSLSEADRRMGADMHKLLDQNNAEAAVLERSKISWSCTWFTTLALAISVKPSRRGSRTRRSDCTWT